MRDHSIPNGLCSLDPITLGLGALTGLASSSLFGSGDTPTAPAAAPPPSAPPPAQAPVGSKKAPGTQQSTFLGASAIPPQTSNQKSLLGQ